MPARTKNYLFQGIETDFQSPDLWFIKTIHMKIFFIPVLFLGFNAASFGQSVNYKIHYNEVNDLRSLQVRLYPEFFIAPGDRELKLPANLILDAHYYLGSLADISAGFSIGSNTGVLLGGSLHLRDHQREVKERFVLSRSTSGRTTTTRFLKVRVTARSFSGPCADAFIGSQMGAFTSKVDLGWSWSGYRHSQIVLDEDRYISGNLNGFHTIKLQAVFQAPIPTSKSYFNEKGPYVTDEGNAAGIGGQLAFDYQFRPWRFCTLYSGLTMGYIKVPDDGSAPILSIRLGATFSKSLKLF